MVEATRYALRSEESWVAIKSGDVLAKGYLTPSGDWRPVQFEPEWADSLDDAALAARDLGRIVETPEPVGVVVLAAGIADGDGGPTRCWETRPLSDEELTALRASKIAQVKAEAERRIIAIMPEHQQRNSIALGLEMTTTHGPDPTNWPAQEQAIYQAVLTDWAKIKAIRTASDAIEADLPNDAEALISFNVADAAGWPA